MKYIKKIIQFFKDSVTTGCTPDRLTLSFCIGVYVAFSPFPGAHWLLMIAFKYLFDLHWPTLFFATSLNNPWTMIPFYSCDYAFGYWLVHSVLQWTPGWEISLAKLFGSGTICVVSFLIGGNALGLVSALVSWPLISRMFTRMATHHKPS